MRPALIVLALVLLTCAAHAQGTPPRREDPLQTKLQSARQLEMIEAALMRRPAAANDRNTTLAQIREDFWRIQLANDSLNGYLANPPALDFRLITKTVSEIRTRAKRLKENLALPRTEKDSAPQTTAAADTRSAVATLSNLIDSFVSNPMLSQRHLVDASMSLQASRDLEDIIVLSGALKKIAAKRD